jgi:hypothetical protein
MRPINISLAPAAASATQIVATTSTGITTGTALTIANGTLDVPRQVIVTTSSASDNSQLVNLVGTNYNGQTISESITTNSSAAVASVGYYKTITSATYVGTTTVGTIAVGTNGVSSTVVIPVDVNADPTNATVQVQVVGTVTYTVEYTLNDCYGTTGPAGPWAATTSFDTPASPALWTTLSGFSSGSVSVVGNIAYPARALRARITAGSGSINLTFIQSGPIS